MFRPNSVRVGLQLPDISVLSDAETVGWTVKTATMGGPDNTIETLAYGANQDIVQLDVSVPGMVIVTATPTASLGSHTVSFDPAGCVVSLTARGTPRNCLSALGRGSSDEGCNISNNSHRENELSWRMDWVLGPPLEAMLVAVKGGVEPASVNVERLVWEWLDRSGADVWRVDPHTVGIRLLEDSMNVRYVNLPKDRQVPVQLPEGTWYPSQLYREPIESPGGRVNIELGGRKGMSLIEWDQRLLLRIGPDWVMDAASPEAPAASMLVHVYPW